jgi:LacI family transcriptional regulator
MRSKRNIPIKEVALAAGVSTQTVSRVANNRPDVSPETRQHVLNVIEQLHYRPSRAARALRGASRSIGVVGFDLELYGPSRTLVGVNHQAKRSNYSIVLELVQEIENLNVDEVLEPLLASHVEGIVWCIPHIGDNMRAITEYARSAQLPVVFSDFAHDLGLSGVEIDNLAGGRLATKHLIEQGHTHIGLITGPLSYFSGRERMHGWRDSLQAHGLLADDSLIAEGDWTAHSGAPALRQILSRHPDLTAVFASNDQMALGAMRAAAQIGLRIPQDLAIVGYDDIPEAEFFTPSLSSIRQNVVELGARAVTEVIRLIEARRLTGKAPPVATLLQPQLVIRESSAHPRSDSQQTERSS